MGERKKSMSKKIKKKLTVSEEQFNNSWDAIFGKSNYGTPMTKEEMKEYAQELTDKINEEIRNEQ